MEEDSEESTSLKHILGDMSVESFFDDIWQKTTAVFRPQNDTVNTPYHHAIENGWNIMTELLEHGGDKVLVFENHCVLDNGDESEHLAATFLKGNSLVWNHADVLTLPLAHLCDDLQKSFPHAYANVYLTPPQSQTAPPHADDRDVLVIQLYGEKDWTVYRNIPIAYPYPHEQVGKDERLPVPEQVLDGPCYNITLQKGHILYMPRGYVHEAHSAQHTSSLHATIAFATQDWTWAGFLQQQAEKVLFQTNPEYRMAVPRTIGRRSRINKKDEFDTFMRQVITTLQNEITFEKLEETMAKRYAFHNDQAEKLRNAIAVDSSSHKKSPFVGWKVPLRVSTPPKSKGVGLNIREDHLFLAELLQIIRAHPEKCYAPCDYSTLIHPNVCCDFVLLCFAKQCVTLGALAVA
jgi:ribosomal protein L16 Arg81 hydroxylase